MCMRIDQEVTEKVKRRLKRGSGKARFWKVYHQRPKSLRSFIWNSSIRTPGRKASSRKSTVIGNAEAEEIGEGWHVFLYKRDTKYFCRPWRIAVPVWCREKDLVAGGTQGWMRSSPQQQAVFTHIEIKPDDFRKAIGLPRRSEAKTGAEK